MLIKKVRQLIKEVADEANWNHHMVPMVNYAKELAEKVGADKEIVEISAWLHDYTRLKGHPKGHRVHHITSSDEAEKILKDSNYPQEKIEEIKYCIITHRGIYQGKRKSLESKVVASADAMAHFNAIPFLFHGVYLKGKCDVGDGVEWVKRKLERSWNKSLLETKELVKDKYNHFKKLIED